MNIINKIPRAIGIFIIVSCFAIASAMDYEDQKINEQIEVGK
tara:strand:+ start:35766 stop:35891 length:126 start_codon:yes stop_codon:yes gene_type:complete